MTWWPGLCAVRWFAGVADASLHDGKEGAMRYVTSHLASLLAGAVLGRLFDRERGRRRRAMLRDRIVSAGHSVSEAADATARDARNRARGVMASLRSGFTDDIPDDRVLAERVRAALGGVARHPGGIDVHVRSGSVRLRGPVLEDEVEAVVHAARKVRGVRAVEDHLDVHSDPGDLPGLQSMPARRRAGRQFELFQRDWSPTARLLAGIAGATTALWGLKRAGAVGSTLGGAGLVLATRAATNLDLARLFGVGAGPDAVTVQKTIEVAAPIEEVWALWSRYEDFPRFMSRVRSVRRGADGTSHWTVEGPAGMPVSWQTVETRREPQACLAWKTVEGALVAHAGIVQFAPTRYGGTRVHVRWHYTPPAGAVGHAVAAVMGADPKRAMDEDLVRLKSLLEEGATRAHGETVRRDAVGGSSGR